MIQPRAPKRRGAFSRFWKFLMSLVALVLIAGIVAGGVILLTSNDATVQVRDYVGNTVRDVVQEIEQNVRGNTDQPPQ